MNRTGVPRVVYCASEDAFYKKLAKQQSDFILESRAIPAKSSPQKFAQNRKAAVLIVRIKNEFDFKHQEWLARNDASVPIIVISQNGTAQTAVHALQYGVFDYFCINQDLKIILKRITEAIAFSNCQTIKRKLEEPDLLIGNDSRILEINELARTHARNHDPVLLYGEAGTGKHHLAYGMYRMTHKDFTPFVHYDCRMLQHISRYDRVSVTDLIRKRLQKLNQKLNRGVLYLSHVEQLNGDQQKEVFRQWKHSPVKLIASYQEQIGARPLESAESSFPTMKIPSLRHRLDDIPIMAEHFIRQTARQRKIRQKSLTTEVVQLMRDYPWPGNVQELSNIVDRMMAIEPSSILSPTCWRVSLGSSSTLRTVHPNQLSALIEEVLKKNRQWEEGGLYKNFMEQMERMLIDLVMPKVDYNQGLAARILGISRTTLREKIR